MTRTDYGAVLLDQKNGSYFQVNEIGADMITALLDTNDPDRAVRALHDRYDAPLDDLRTDLLSYLQQLAQSGLIDDDLR
ncbi:MULTISPECIES: PqqD family peptide modification chaperone [Rhodococcus]|jgi:hypothetical protein|nr:MULTISPECIES: PqqD family peptide modification chaperone [Rhodococcus]MCF8786698.1 PqqD family peptide modification chaperone [Rhodococcus ruber]MDO1481574.1 PqqD family protein [Rhodococcus ruber]MDV6296470.1 PqqD family peptide modification chaperone [Rhodococcus aetherivorans]